jgi:hypothetical protein
MARRGMHPLMVGWRRWHNTPALCFGLVFFYRHPPIQRKQFWLLAGTLAAAAGGGVRGLVRRVRAAVRRAVARAVPVASSGGFHVIIFAGVVETDAERERAVVVWAGCLSPVGLQVEWFQSAWFQTLSLQRDILVSSLCFQVAACTPLRCGRHARRRTRRYRR